MRNSTTGNSELIGLHGTAKVHYYGLCQKYNGKVNSKVKGKIHNTMHDSLVVRGSYLVGLGYDCSLPL